MLNDKEDIFAAALLAIGASINSDAHEELDQAASKLVDQAERMQARFIDLEVAEDLLLAGDVWAAQIYSGDAVMLAEENENIDYFIPEEGAPLWLDNFAIPRNAENAASAHRFIDFMARGEIAARNANYVWVATPNKAAEQYLDEELLADETVYPPKDVLARCEFYGQPSAEREKFMNQGMKLVLDYVRTGDEASLTSKSDDSED